MARPKAKTPNFDAQLKEVVSERTKIENQLHKAQDKLRGTDRQQEAEKYAELLAPVNDLKQRLASITQQHAELARMVATMKGGTNHAPQP